MAAPPLSSPAALTRYLRGGGDPNAASGEPPWSLLEQAIEHGQFDLIRLLVAHGANLNEQTSQGWFPIHHAIDIDIDSALQSTGSLAHVTFATTKLLLELGAAAGSRDTGGDTILDYVANYCVPAEAESAVLLERFTSLLAQSAP